MSWDAALKTNKVYEEINEFMEDEPRSLHALVLKLMNAVREERISTQKEFELLRQECDIKAFYIQQLEKANVEKAKVTTSPALEKIENDLLRLLNTASDTLARVTHLRTTQ